MTENELIHYGVKGMRWGVRRYRNKDGTLTPAGKKRYSSRETNSKSIRSKKASDVIASGYASDALAMEAVTITAMMGLMFATAKLSAVAFKKSKMSELEKMKNASAFKSKKELPKLKKREKPEESMKRTNPDFPSTGSTMNCTFCTTAMALREKGYDVIAKKTKSGWPSEELFAKTFNSPTVKMSKRQNADEMIKTLSDIGDCAYGNLVVNWKVGGAHSIFWKNVGGRTHIYDGQSGQEYDVSNPSQSPLLRAIRLNSVIYNRLDNCDPTDYALALVDKRSE